MSDDLRLHDLDLSGRWRAIVADEELRRTWQRDDFDDAQFTAEALAKDTRLMLATADTPLPAVALVAAELQRAVDAGQGDKDFSVIARDR